MNEPLTSDPSQGLPEGSVAEGEIRIISYINDEGESMYAYSRSPDMALAHIIGLLEMVKLHISHELIHSYDEEEEDD